MDLVTAKQVETFAKEYSLEDLKPDSQFEHYAAFSTVRRHYDRTFDPTDLVIGGGGDTGVDAIAIIVNNVLVTDGDQVDELAEQNGYLDVTFIFVQAERSPSFNATTLSGLAAGVVDFFQEKPKLQRNERLQEIAEIGSLIYGKSGLFSRKRPSLICYYVTTGKWQDDANLNAYRTIAIEEFDAMKMFSSPSYTCFGADEIQYAYNQTRNPVTRHFTFQNRTDAPPIPGIQQAFLGFIPYGEFRKIVSDESGREILGSIFEGNVRDWQEYTQVNEAIRETLASDARSRFVLMNNGITIIAKTIQQANHRFTIADFQIVNGCQTSHVVFNEEGLEDSVCIPLRLIETRDEAVIESIIHATNNQSPLRPEQLYALMRFSKKLEEFFRAYAYPHTLYYERRDGQYNREGIEKTRIVVPANVIKGFAAMFLNQPHRTTRSVKVLREKVGKDIYGKDHRLEPYYASAYALYRLDKLFRNDSRFLPVYKPARYHVLMATRLIVNREPLPAMNSHAMKRRSEELLEALWSDTAETTFLQAIDKVSKVAEGRFDRDHIRQKPITDALLQEFGLNPEQD